MFTFLQGNVVRTGQSGHAYVFDAMSGETYIFNRPMIKGAQSQVQLVTNIRTHEVVVQKVSKRKPTIKDGYDLAKVPEDNEVRILDHLNALVLNPVYDLPSVTPRWSTCISHEKIAVESRGRRPKIQCLQISYWKFCNANSVASVFSNWCAGHMANDMEGRLFPAGSEAVYHCDLHMGNIFVHYDEQSAKDGLPDFYIGDFGWACTASESLAHSEASHDDRGRKYLHPGYSPPFTSSSPFREPTPGAARPGERRRWDVDRLIGGVWQLERHTVLPWTNAWTMKPASPPPPSKQAEGLQRLMRMIKFVDAQDETMAARNPRSRPPSLVEVVREARKLEASALRAERGTIDFEMFSKWGQTKLAQSKEEAPFVFPSENRGAPFQIQELRVARAENYGNTNIEGPWTLVNSE
ncbi:uncharacterized protein B0H64DRAFT_431372 [Chaetomium fimeti]|uniref:Protein kinase domain-containing protein n=1 Tax=Chaetomium fimeti TaxID=1854472 RepID=A0AAE0LTQ6_9PEZI|nr:hypothetical protein B0H64DRAFT_431372 [Chaetomium fimeti]